jgi:hypothetical protein
MAEDIPVFPITGYTIGPITSMGIVIIQFPFLASPMQELAKADPGRRYALTPEQAREVRDAIDRAIPKLGSGQASPDQTH